MIKRAALDATDAVNVNASPGIKLHPDLVENPVSNFGWRLISLQLAH
jgi:hypothetical protein